MPQATLSARAVLDGLPGVGTERELHDLLFDRSKAELVRRTTEELVVEATPDRLDLLAEGGLRQHLEGLLGVRSGLPPVPRRPSDDARVHIEVDRSVERVRPAIAAVLVEAPPGGALDAALLAEAVRFQELLHATIGLDRRSASLGIYPLARLRAPISYRLAPVGGLRFTPLQAESEQSVAEFLAHHPYALKYGSHGRSGEEVLVLRDAAGVILSLPPILNSREAGEARPGDRTLLLESTGTRSARVEDAVGLLELPFLSRGWSVAPVAIEQADGARTGEELVRPSRVALDVATLARTGGLDLPEPEVLGALRSARLGAERTSGGYEVEVPPWRPDLGSAVDLAEEVLLARGVRTEERRLPPSRTRGRRLPDAPLRSAMRERLLGLGFVPLFSTVLQPAALVATLGRTAAIPLANPVSQELSHLRDALQLPLLAALGHNTRYGYPQRWSEVGPVVVPDRSAESGARTRERVGLLLAGDGAGFADGAALVDHLLRRAGVAGVREPAELPATIRGRAARLRIAGEPIAEIGEVAPEVLDALGVPVPAVWAEVDLTHLEPLLSGVARAE